MRDNMHKDDYAIALLALYGLSFEGIKQGVKEKINKLDIALINQYVRPAHRNIVLSRYMLFKDGECSDIVKEERQKYRITSVAYRHMLANYQYEIQAILDREGIRSSFIKGICFDYCWFPDDSKMFRFARDIDILIHPDDVLKDIDHFLKVSMKDNGAKR